MSNKQPPRPDAGERVPRPLFADERRQAILEIARQEGRVDVSELGRRFAVTTETIRRDLGHLDRLGSIRRVHGGAVSAEPLHIVPEFSQRSDMRTEEKRAIARVALAELPMDGAILIDSGTTAAQIAELLPSDVELTVVTSSIPVAQSLSARPGITLHLLGGRVRSTTLSTVESWTLRALSEVTVDVAFMGTSGVSARRGLTTVDPSEGAVKTAMFGAARKVILLADHTKLGAEHLWIFASLPDVAVLVTDEGADVAVVDDLRQAGLRVALAALADGLASPVGA